MFSVGIFKTEVPILLRISSAFFWVIPVFPPAVNAAGSIQQGDVSDTEGTESLIQNPNMTFLSRNATYFIQKSNKNN